ncbi:DUF922 domain-containing protein [Nonlabens xiamenensis]|uniref:DUF922 domain-containing protein n=1 Tax=Nonlabens xiamenensis TaxID=2341043 RepID=UPI000F6052C4|nr:DUF922 domain-containing protein [Nonlabens xiamenensis]
MKWLVTLSALVLCLNSEPKERWTYQEHPTLSWEDFRGTPPSNADHHASVNSGMGYQFSSSMQNGEWHVDVRVNSYFYPQLSWKKELDEHDRALLAHEQLHWDISELYARQLREAYSRYVPKNEPKKEVDFIFKVFEKKRRARQQNYDRESQHGNNKEAQSHWQQQIREELFTYSAWAQTDQ